MAWVQILIQTILGWLLEIPPNLLGRGIERLLDRSSDGRRRKRKSWRRKRRISRRPAKAEK